MKLRVLGCAGGETPEHGTTCFLIDNRFTVDAGAICSNLDLKSQRKIEFTLVTHSHLDHIRDLAFLVDNMVGMRQNPYVVYSAQGTIDTLRKHFFNDSIWPDFTSIPNKDSPVLQLKAIPTDSSVVKIEGYEVRSVPVNHIPHSVGYVVSKGNAAFLFTGDTASTDAIWEIARQTPHLKAIFTEISFPNGLRNIAELSKHFCTATFVDELKKMSGIKVPIYVSHFKPGLEADLKREFELEKLASKGVRILNQGDEFNF